MGIRVYVEKKSTGAIWSSVMPNLGIWRKESLGVGYEPNTQQVGYVSQFFNPFSRKNRKKFRRIEV